MSPAGSERKGARITISTSAEVVGYLEDLAALGIHGKAKAEVAQWLLSNEIERLIREGILKLRADK